MRWLWGIPAVVAVVIVLLLLGGEHGPAPVPDVAVPGELEEERARLVEPGGSGPAQGDSRAPAEGLGPESSHGLGERAVRWTAQQSPPKSIWEPFLVTWSGSLRTPLWQDVSSNAVSGVLVAVDGSSIPLAADEGRLVSLPVPVGVYELVVEAPGYRHFPQQVDLTQPVFGEDGSRAGSSRNRMVTMGEDGAPRYMDTVTLWPDSVLPVLVQTREGVGFRELTDPADDRERNFFSDAFVVVPSLEPLPTEGPAPAEAVRAGDRRVAAFSRGGGMEAGSAQRGLLGALETGDHLPLWVGCWMNDVFLGSHTIRAADRAVIFEVDESLLLGGHGSLSFRALGAETNQPAFDALVTLTASDPDDQRDEFTLQSPGEGGRVHFAELGPGVYTLAVNRVGGTAQRRIDLAPGEHQNIGTLWVSRGPGIRITAVDAEGAPARGTIQLGPYRAGEDEQDLYLDGLSRPVGSDGHDDLPVPDVSSIVRFLPQGAGAGFATPSVRIRPGSEPKSIEFTVRKPRTVHARFPADWDRDHTLTVENDLELVVARLGPGGAQSALLCPGNYVVRRRAGDTELASERFTLTEIGPAQLPVP